MNAHVSEPRHQQAVEIMQRAANTLPGTVKYVVLIYDGPSVPPLERKLSWATDAPIGDMRLVCDAVAKSAR